LARVSRAASLLVILTAIAAFLNAAQATSWTMQLSRFAVGGMIGCAVALLLLGLGYIATKRVRDV
jgi:hypothetical protein